MQVIGQPNTAFKPLRVRTSAMESQEEARQRRIAGREAREEARAAASRIAEEAADRRSERNRGTFAERVESAKQRLANTPVGAAIGIIGANSIAEREVYLLAEEFGQHRDPVLRAFPPIRTAARETYLQLVAETPPNEPEAPKAAPAKRARKSAKETE